MIDKYGAFVGGGKLAGDTEVLGENLPHLQLCPPLISYDLTYDQTRVAAV
jgi:hypothetical protein